MYYGLVLRQDHLNNNVNEGKLMLLSQLKLIIRVRHDVYILGDAILNLIATCHLQ